MEGLLLLVPIILSLGNCIITNIHIYSSNNRMNNLLNLIQSNNYSIQRYSAPIPPAASAPPDSPNAYYNEN